MNTHQLLNAVNKIYSVKKNFRGIFPIDKIPSLPTPGYYIINLDKSHEPGSHWVSVQIKAKGKNEFFDSYGFPPQCKELKQMVGKKIIINKKKLQFKYSTSCGQWCLYYIYFSHLGFSIPKIFANFSGKNSYANDYHMNNIICILYKIKTKVIDEKFLTDQIVKSLTQNYQCCEYYCKIRQRKKCVTKRRVFPKHF